MECSKSSWNRSPRRMWSFCANLRSRRATVNFQKSLKRAKCHFLGKYATFTEAVAATPRHRRFGYDHAEAAEMYLHDFRNMRTSDYPVIYWTQKNFCARLRAFDWGGNVGHAYYAYQDDLTDPRQLIWMICNVPQMTRVGARLALDSDPTDRDGHDVLLIAGTLQFLAQPLTACFGRCLESRAD